MLIHHVATIGTVPETKLCSNAGRKSRAGQTDRRGHFGST